jgi:hypothetical protein
MSLAVIWDRSSTEPAPAPGDIALCFDKLTVAHLLALGVVAVSADDLLDVDGCARLDTEASELVDAVRVGLPASEPAALELLGEFVNVLRAWRIGEGMRERGATGPLLVGRSCPSAIRAGLSVALARAPALVPWVPIPGGEPAPGGPRPALAAAALRASSLRTGAREVRVLAVPGGKVGAALDAVPVSALHAAGVAVTVFPGLDHGNAARMALRRGLAAVAAPRGWRHGQGRLVSRELALGRLHDVPELDRVLRAVAARVIAARCATDAPAAAVLRSWERLPALRAVVLPTSVTAAACRAVDWARRRGLETAVVQHGIYGSKAPQYGDGRAGTLLAWGPGVAEQARGWAAPRPRVVAVGVPGLHGRAPLRRPTAITRVLVATTNRPLGLALGLFGFCEAFVDDLAAGLRELRAAGVALELRPHPAEDVTRYHAQLARLDVDLPVGPPGPFVERLCANDLLVTSISSVAFEAAALGAPVLLWSGRVPAAIRAEHMLAPLGDALPGLFDGERAFLALARRALRAPAELIDEALRLSELLAGYAQPFDRDAFTTALAELGA